MKSINSLFDLTNKVAIITGGASGIGKQTAHLLAQAGANIVIADIHLDKAEEVAKEVENYGIKALAIHCNILEDDSLTKLVDTVVSEFGSINILINNAGGGRAGAENPFKISVSDFKKDFELNVFSAWRLCQLCVPHMKKSGYGSIVITTSMSSINKSPNVSAYAASKASVNHMVANLAYDFGPEVRINAVGPGATRTPALDTVLTPEIESKMLEKTPIKRLGTPNDIAGAMLYFASPISEWVSGQTLFINGGGVQTLD